MPFSIVQYSAVQYDAWNELKGRFPCPPELCISLAALLVCSPHLTTLKRSMR